MAATEGLPGHFTPLGRSDNSTATYMSEVSIVLCSPLNVSDTSELLAFKHFYFFNQFVWKDTGSLSVLMVAPFYDQALKPWWLALSLQVVCLNTNSNLYLHYASTERCVSQVCFVSPVHSRVVQRPSVLRGQVAVKHRPSHHTDVEHHSDVLEDKDISVKTSGDINAFIITQ